MVIIHGLYCSLSEAKPCTWSLVFCLHCIMYPKALLRGVLVIPILKYIWSFFNSFSMYVLTRRMNTLKGSNRNHEEPLTAQVNSLKRDIKRYYFRFPRYWIFACVCVCVYVWNHISVRLGITPEGILGNNFSVASVFEMTCIWRAQLPGGTLPGPESGLLSNTPFEGVKRTLRGFSLPDFAKRTWEGHLLGPLNLHFLFWGSC